MPFVLLISVIGIISVYSEYSNLEKYLMCDIQVSIPICLNAFFFDIVQSILKMLF